VQLCGYHHTIARGSGRLGSEKSSDDMTHPEYRDKAHCQRFPVVGFFVCVPGKGIYIHGGETVKGDEYAKPIHHWR